MPQMIVLIPIKDIMLDREKILVIQRDDLLLVLNDQYHLNHYADHIVQAQAQRLSGVDPYLTNQLSQTIEQLIQVLSDSKKYLKVRKFNALQKWLGIDIEYGAGQIEYYKKLEFLLAKANQLSQKLQIEIEKSRKRIEEIHLYRDEMAHYISAAESFLNEYPKFVKDIHPLDNFSERLSKKIMSLMTLQANNDIAITQMQLSEQIAFTLLDRFNEAQQILIPAWQYYVKQSHQSVSKTDLEKLDHTRQDLISTLKKSLEKIT
ncbi:hypothetical protein [Acinetobacter equi]|uniref:Tellurium resistance protein n=1 Tax=Acinetobacter equi TaxID=1324350 RepID=A0A0N9W1V7_9GAMM|nr:hypothetical protein [Acinetobacter equi]ALH95623.1 tellurium resistance protein [Acinetobacter equi]